MLPIHPCGIECWPRRCGWVSALPARSVSRVARANLCRALPELDARARRRVLLGVWENLGRTVAELPHIGSLRRTADGPGWECEDDTVLCALRDHGGPAILFSGHLANWEIGLPVAASLGLAVSWFYRAASNPAADAAIQDMRHCCWPDAGARRDREAQQNSGELSGHCCLYVAFNSNTLKCHGVWSIKRPGSTDSLPSRS
jgi:Bacterial lipid A biosynthesis acyltransferase